MFVSFKSSTTVSLVEQELPPMEGAREFTTGLSVARVAQSVAFYVVFCRLFLVLLLLDIKKVIKKEYDLHIAGCIPKHRT